MKYDVVLTTYHVRLSVMSLPIADPGFPDSRIGVAGPRGGRDG
jgi:hypothetical protein